jgi:hypothetical protein
MGERVGVRANRDRRNRHVPAVSHAGSAATVAGAAPTRPVVARTGVGSVDPVSTRRLIIAAMLCGVAILGAFALQLVVAAK